LIQLRLKHIAFLDGNYVKTITSDTGLYASISQAEGDVVLTVINLKSEDIVDPKFTLAAAGLDGKV
jgi:hypothetical protein